MCGSPEYRSWSAMLQRCTNPNADTFARYGGAGVTVCPQWRRFEQFYADMGPKPTPDHTIERIENKRGYEPSNCRWATRMEQQNNIRSNVLITYRGETKTLTQWCRELGLSEKRIRFRLTKPWWTIEDAFTKRKQSGGRRKRAA